ncbi:hypothetical protein AB0L82_22920 [Nocardia sp. NPDC052001]|uniref:hypothetical protein n=1 Tax=Nocardia sp. NPDC052001 TaxID=3154853 RepID=UPI00342C2EC8
MSNQRFRTGIVAVSGALLLALAGPMTMATATAAPANPNYPLGPDPSTPGQQQKDEKPEKAGKLGGTVTTKVIDLATGVLKCGLNIALPAVKCDL